MVIVYEGVYDRKGPETYNIYAIQSQSSPDNYSSQVIQQTFTLVQSAYGEIPADWVYYFGFTTQRINDNKEYSLLNEQIFFTIQ